jgi:hypothetical protein
MAVFSNFLRHFKIGFSPKGAQKVHNPLKMVQKGGFSTKEAVSFYAFFRAAFLLDIRKQMPLRVPAHVRISLPLWSRWRVPIVRLRLLYQRRFQSSCLRLYVGKRGGEAKTGYGCDFYVFFTPLLLTSVIFGLVDVAETLEITGFVPCCELRYFGCSKKPHFLSILSTLFGRIVGATAYVVLGLAMGIP